jgi:hypothetical protein
MTRLKLRERPSAHKAAVVRENGKKGGHPAGSKDNLPGREKLRLAGGEMADELLRLGLHGKTENVRVAALRDGLAYAWGRPPQPHDGDGAGGPIIIKIITQVPGPDDD